MTDPTVLIENGDATNKLTGETYVTASFTPTANAVVFLLLSTGHSSLPSVSGDLTWSGVNSMPFNTTGTPTTRISVWKADAGASPPTGAVTVTVNGNTTHGMWKVLEYTGHDPDAPAPQTAVNAADASAAIAATLGAFAAPQNGTLLVMGYDAVGGTLTLEDGYADVGTRQQFEASLHASWNSGNDTSPTATISTVRDWGAIALEIAAATGQPARPSADVSDGNWLGFSGQTSLYEQIDEATTDDADGVRSPADPVDEACEVELSDLSTPAAGDVTLWIRHRKTP